MEVMARAAFEVELYENRIALLRSVHKQCSEPFDWHAVLNQSAPQEPVAVTTRQERARIRLERFRPGFLHKLLKTEEKKRQHLEAKLALATADDEREHFVALKTYERDLAEWQASQALAKGVLEGEPEAYVEAIQQVGPFTDIGELGSSLIFRSDIPWIIEVTLFVNSKDVIPEVVKTLTKAGKLSEKKMPKGAFYELYQDYVCGCILRVARELFALLPIQMVIVTAVGELLNTATGHLEGTPIVSVAIPVQTLARLNFTAIDPSDSMTNFVHRMKFQKTKGFSAVQALKPTDLQSVS
jgi:hypothetical protein